jgi:hypothetical protein
MTSLRSSYRKRLEAEQSDPIEEDSLRDDVEQDAETEGHEYPDEPVQIEEPPEPERQQQAPEPRLERPAPQAAPRGPRGPTVSMPVSRESPSWSSGRTAPSETVLTAEEMDFAKNYSGISVEEYRQQKARMIANGANQR